MFSFHVFVSLLIFSFDISHNKWINYVYRNNSSRNNETNFSIEKSNGRKTIPYRLVLNNKMRELDRKRSPSRFNLWLYFVKTNKCIFFCLLFLNMYVSYWLADFERICRWLDSLELNEFCLDWRGWKSIWNVFARITELVINKIGKCEQWWRISINSNISAKLFVAILWLCTADQPFKIPVGAVKITKVILERNTYNITLCSLQSWFFRVPKRHRRWEARRRKPNIKVTFVDIINIGRMKLFKPILSIKIKLVKEYV